MRIMSVVGARPEFIKAGPVSREFAERGVDEILVHTGQHYDDSMSDAFFAALGLRQADHFLGVGSGPHGRQTGRMLEALEQLMLVHHVDGVLVYGDTNSTLAGALAAAKLHIPVIHVEAGLRSFNRLMPEETNRILTDHVSSVLFCPTQTAVYNLANEGITQGVHLVGDVNQDALDYWIANSQGDGAVASEYDLEKGLYYVATVHRAENVDDPIRLRNILHALNSLPHRVTLPLHPRTKKALASLGIGPLDNIRFTEPVGFLEMLELTKSAAAVLTDSGGLQKEAYMLGVPCVTLRDETEWVETVSSGWNSLVGSDKDAILGAVAGAQTPMARPPIFGDGQTSRLIADVLIAEL